MNSDMENAKVDLRSDSLEIRARGVRLVEALAAKGDAMAMYVQATWYLHGTHGYELNPQRASDLLQLSAASFIPEALYDLAVLTEKTVNSRGKNKEAFGLYVIAAILGDRDSIQELIRCFYWGIGTFNNKKASEYLQEIMNMRDLSE